jgi:two-component system, NtrC family, sensor histidine kinase PilS
VSTPEGTEPVTGVSPPGPAAPALAPSQGGERGHRRHPPERGRYPTWGALRWLLLFRLFLASGLALAFSPSFGDALTGGADNRLAWGVLVIYTLLVLASGLSLYAQWPKRENQVYLAVFTDIVAFALLMHAGGGVGSGFGGLLAVSVAAGALMMEGRLSLLFAAFATLAVMTQQTYIELQGAAPASAYTQAGLLGILFFAVALLARFLYRRLRAMEELAARRKVDIDDLSKLNAFIIENVGTGILVVDGDRRLRLTNQAARDLLGAADPQPGTPLGRLSSELAAWLAKHAHPSASQGGVIRVGDREVRPSRQLLGDYRATGVLLYLRDHQELLREAQQIKLASLGILTASIAHNIRNPLSAIAQAGQLLEEDRDLTAEDRHLLEIIRRNTGRIDEIVQSVLQLSRRNRVDPRQLELVSWLEDFCAEFRESHGLDERQLRLHCEPPPLNAETDPRHLHQIVSNLCENALLHAARPDGPAHIQIRAGRGDGQETVMVEVRDDGPGIDDETAREMFTPFYTTRAGGTGLGLYIARELSETNGIRLLYERATPSGSCFRLSFG